MSQEPGTPGVVGLEGEPAIFTDEEERDAYARNPYTHRGGVETRSGGYFAERFGPYQLSPDQNGISN
jgi:hypothetical protein